MDVSPVGRSRTYCAPDKDQVTSDVESDEVYHLHHLTSRCAPSETCALRSTGVFTKSNRIARCCGESCKSHPRFDVAPLFFHVQPHPCLCRYVVSPRETGRPSSSELSISKITQAAGISASLLMVRQYFGKILGNTNTFGSLQRSSCLCGRGGEPQREGRHDSSSAHCGTVPVSLSHFCCCRRTDQSSASATHR